MKLSTVLVLFPVAVLATLIAVANRQEVTFRLEPFSSAENAAGISAPLFALVFLTFLFGVLVGGATVAVQRARSQRRKRLAAKDIGAALALDAAKEPGSQSAK